MIAEGFKLEAVGDDAERASSAGVADQVHAQLCAHQFSSLLTNCQSAASIESSQDEVDLSNWNASTDAYTFLYNPDLWQQGGEDFLCSLHLVA